MKKLTISLLVSGREETTEKCLDSLRGLRSAVDSELILVDTGCDDKMREVLARYTDQIIPFAWRDDFAAARNVGIEHAQGEWFLFLDDDEWFEDVTPLIDFFQSAESEEYEQAVYKVRNYQDLQGTNYTEDWVSRIIRLHKDTHFVGKVHEYLTPFIGKCKQLDAYVHHYGYAYKDEETAQKHLERNVSLLKSALQEEPNNLKWHIQLVQEYCSAKRMDEAKRAAEEALRLLQNEDKPFMNQSRGTFYNAVVLAVMEEGNYEEAAAKCARFIMDKRNSSVCQCSLCRHAAESAVKYHNYELVERFCSRYMGFYEKAKEEYQAQSEQEQIISDSALLVNDALEQPVYYKMLLYWAESLAVQQKEAELPQEKKEELSVYVDKLIKDNGDFLHLPETVWKLHDLVGLEDKLLGLDFSQWSAAISYLTSHSSPAEAEKIQEKLHAMKRREDMRYDYFDMSYAQMLISLNLVDEDYSGICYRFRTFGDSTLKFYRQVYLDRVFEEEPDMLPAECRAAVCMQDFFARKEQDWEGKLQDLKRCAKEDVSLGEQVKSFAKLLGEEQERCAKAAEEASDQLRQMAEIVKQKVEVMLQGGLYAEALQTVKQLRTMLPDDEELKELEEKILGQL